MRLLKTENRKINVEKLRISDAYQRTIVPARVGRIEKSFDADAFGSLTVGERRDASLWVVDGMQRLTAAIRLGIESVPCDVFQSEGPEHEAKVFRLKNKERTSVSACSLFRAQLVEGDPQTVDIARVVQEAGLKLKLDEGSSGWPYVKAVVALEGAYRRIGRGGLLEALALIIKAWPGDPDCLRGDVIGGMSWFIRRNEMFDRSRLIAKLTRTSVVSIIRASDATLKLERDRGVSSSQSGRAMTTCIALEFIYNKGLRRNRVGE